MLLLQNLFPFGVNFWRYLVVKNDRAQRCRGYSLCVNELLISLTPAATCPSLAASRKFTTGSMMLIRLTPSGFAHLRLGLQDPLPFII